MKTLVALAAMAAVTIAAAPAGAGLCIVPDNGNGTADLPPNCTEGYLSPDDVHMILDGLPPSPPTTIILDASHNEFILRSGGPGGNLGGEFEIFDSFLNINLQGTGLLAGLNHNMVLQAQTETHIGPRNPGDPVQSFPTEMFNLFGTHSDSLFQNFTIVAGSSQGLPSPGQTTLTQLPSGDFHVDSFFDVTYRIDFEGAPGSALDGMSGSTTATILMQAGEPFPEPSALLMLAATASAALVRRGRRARRN
ncbi:MAG: hypothetical protein CMJ18_24115 [Phycisphaeraceae bacterium]|nr:hypothetical protein [Phycisphaeraceae bacterium]